MLPFGTAAPPIHCGHCGRVRRRSRWFVLCDFLGAGAGLHGPSFSASLRDYSARRLHGVVRHVIAQSISEIPEPEFECDEAVLAAVESCLSEGCNVEARAHLKVAEEFARPPAKPFSKSLKPKNG